MLVYSIRNSMNGKLYIGKTEHSLQRRLSEHLRASMRGSLYPLHCAIRKYGRDAFTASVLSHCFLREWLNRMERYWIKQLSSMFPKGYNVQLGGDGGKTRGNTGLKHTDAARTKIGRANALALNGRKLTLERREAIRQGCLRRQPESWNYLRGKKQTSVTIQKRVEKNLGKKRTAAQRENTRAAWTPELRAYQSAATKASWVRRKEKLRVF
jgi:group I intron endonuclease